MQIRDATRDDLTRLGTFLPEAFELDFDPAPVLEEKLFGPGYGGPARCFVALLDGVVRGVAVTCGSSLRLIAVDPSHRRRGVGSALLDRAIGEISVTSRRITVGAAAGNYLVPGIPSDHHEAIEFFTNRGFESGVRTTDMKAAVDDVVRPEPHPEVAVDRLHSSDEAVARFLTTEFGQSIAWEIGHGLLSSRSIIRIARAGGSILGFTACEINNAGLGSFGPQGVTPAARGKGLGTLLLHHSLADLRELGYSEARIPWVSSTEYYARSCGATVAGTYVVMRRG